jgi:hypothetical protein
LLTLQNPHSVDVTILGLRFSMASCSICNNDSPASARYCANCGTVLGETNTRSPFEVGRIAALDSVKSEIVKWLGVPFAILTAVAGVLGYFGVANIINSEVHEQVEKELDKNFATTTNEIMKKFVDISNQEGSINALETQAQHALADLQDTKKQLSASLAETQRDQGILTTSIQSSTKQEKALEQEISSLKLGPFLAKLSYDFYHVREFAISGFIDIEPSANLDFSFPHAEYINLIGDSDGGADRVRLERSEASAQENTAGITGINIQFALPIAEQDKVINKKIDIFSSLNTIQIVFYCN